MHYWPWCSPGACWGSLLHSSRITGDLQQSAIGKRGREGGGENTSPTKMFVLDLLEAHARIICGSPYKKFAHLCHISHSLSLLLHDSQNFTFSTLVACQVVWFCCGRAPASQVEVCRFFVALSFSSYFSTLVIALASCLIYAKPLGHPFRAFIEYICGCVLFQDVTVREIRGR